MFVCARYSHIRIYIKIYQFVVVVVDWFYLFYIYDVDSHSPNAAGYNSNGRPPYWFVLVFVRTSVCSF